MAGKSRKSETLLDTAKEQEKKTNSEGKKASSGNKLTFCLAIGLPPAFQSPAERAKSRRVGTGQLGPLSQCVEEVLSLGTGQKAGMCYQAILQEVAET